MIIKFKSKMVQCTTHRQHLRTSIISCKLLTNVVVIRIYIADKLFNWTKRQGGLKALDQQSEEKSQLVYELIDQSNGFYVNSIEKSVRSRVNIPLRIITNGVPDEKLEAQFLSEAIKANMIELKGHRAVGGIRISLYNGMTIGETRQLVDFMRAFQKKQNS